MLSTLRKELLEVTTPLGGTSIPHTCSETENDDDDLLRKIAHNLLHIQAHPAYLRRQSPFPRRRYKSVSAMFGRNPNCPSAPNPTSPDPMPLGQLAYDQMWRCRISQLRAGE